MKAISVSLAMALVLAGCGGGPGNDVPNNPNVEPEPPSLLGIFKKEPIVLPEFRNYFIPKSDQCPGNVSIISAADLNSDGKNDLVVHMWCGVPQGEVGKPKTEITPDSLAVFIQKTNGVFEYANEEVFGKKDVRLQGASRKVVVKDFNNDGYPDLAYAVNLEDGRYVDNAGITQYAEPAVMLSEGNGKYRIVKINVPNWYHSVEAVKNDVGSYDVIFAGFGPEQAPVIRFEGTSFKHVVGYPNVSGLMFRSSADGNVIITTAHNSASFDKFSKINSKWSKTGEFLTNGNYVQYIAWQGSLGTVFAVQGEENQVHVGAGYDDGCFLKLTPSETIFVGKYSGQVADTTISSTPYLQSLNNKIVSRLDAFKVDPNFVKMPSIIVDEVKDAQYIFFKCADVNNDGFDDIVVYETNKQGTPLFYINNKQGKLVKANTSEYPKMTQGYGATSLYEDLDGDGVRDLLFYTHFGTMLPLMYKGTTNIGF